MKIENVEVFGFRASFRGLRNPMNSWDKSDSVFNQASIETGLSGFGYRVFDYGHISVPEHPQIGPKDLELACKLIKNGSEHRKFLRQISIWIDITIPRYVHQELDTYKVATVRNSCSTMHKLGSIDLAQEDFEYPIPDFILEHLNKLGQEFRAAGLIKDSKRQNEIHSEYKNILPEGYLQKATYTMNYETAITMYRQRKNHRLPQWRAGKKGGICSFLECLPYMNDFLSAAGLMEK